jgi:hypothetical protein
MVAIDYSERTVSRLVPKRTGKPQTWMTFLRNHVGQMVSVDFFTVATIKLRVLYVFVILAHERRRVLHFNVTENPTADGLLDRSWKRFWTTLCLNSGTKS